VKRFCGVLLVVAVVLVAMASVAQAGYCGAERTGCSRRACCPETRCGCCQQTCTVMKTCKKVVYEEKKITTYETVYEDVPEPKTVEGVKYVAQTEERTVPYTVSETRETPCAPCAKACDPAACGQPAKCTEQVPVACLRKVPVTVFRAEPTKETVQAVRCVEKKIPHTITVLCPKEVEEQVPVEVCCPVPCCCKSKCGCGK